MFLVGAFMFCCDALVFLALWVHPPAAQITDLEQAEQHCIDVVEFEAFGHSSLPVGGIRKVQVLAQVDLFKFFFQLREQALCRL